MPIKKLRNYNVRWHHPASLINRADVSFSAASDALALRKLPKIAAEVQCTNCPGRLEERPSALSYQTRVVREFRSMAELQ